MDKMDKMNKMDNKEKLIKEGKNNCNDGVDIQIFVKNTNAKTYTLSVKNNDTIFDVKCKLIDKNGVKINNLRLFFASKELMNDKTIQDYNIQKESTLHMPCKNLGG